MSDRHDPPRLRQGRDPAFAELFEGLDQARDLAPSVEQLARIRAGLTVAMAQVREGPTPDQSVEESSKLTQSGDEGERGEQAEQASARAPDERPNDHVDGRRTAQDPMHTGEQVERAAASTARVKLRHPRLGFAWAAGAGLGALLTFALVAQRTSRTPHPPGLAQVAPAAADASIETPRHGFSASRFAAATPAADDASVDASKQGEPNEGASLAHAPAAPAVVPAGDHTRQDAQPAGEPRVAAAAPLGADQRGRGRAAARKQPLPREREDAAPSAMAELRLLNRARAHARSAPEKALSLVAEHAQRYADGLLCEEREVIAVEALIFAGERAQAEQRAAQFFARFRDSAHARRVRVLLSEEVDDSNKKSAPARHSEQ